MLLDTNQIQQAKQLVEDHFGRKIVDTNGIYLHGFDYASLRPGVQNRRNKVLFGTLCFATNANEEIGEVDIDNVHTTLVDMSYYSGLPGQVVKLDNIMIQSISNSTEFNAFFFVGVEFILEAEA